MKLTRIYSIMVINIIKQSHLQDMLDLEQIIATNIFLNYTLIDIEIESHIITI
jgi:hypothetical protein